MENIISYLVQAIINTAALHTSSLLEYTSFDTKNFQYMYMYVFVQDFVSTELICKPAV